MIENKEIYTGLYVFGDMVENLSFGGVSGFIKLPHYNNEVMLFINKTHEHKHEKFDNAMVYAFKLSELKAIHEAIGNVLNDVRKLESLSKKGLLKDEAYTSE